jgi:hypothetical protein
MKLVFGKLMWYGGIQGRKIITVNGIKIIYIYSTSTELLTHHIVGLPMVDYAHYFTQKERQIDNDW